MLVPESALDSFDNALLLQRLESSVNTAKSGSKKEIQSSGIISDLFDKKILSHLEHIFSTSESGDNSLGAAQFKALIAQYIPLSLVENIYRAIDVNDVGRVNYSDFTNYLISSEAGSSFSSKAYTTRIVVAVQQEDTQAAAHRDFIDCLVFVRKPCPMLITGGRDGLVSLWDPSDLSHIKSVAHRDNNSVYREELQRSMDTLLKARCAKHGSSSSRKKDKIAITAMCPLLSSGLLCVGSADCCVTIYELGNQEVCGRFSGMDCVPTAIECFAAKQHFRPDGPSSGEGSGADRDVPARYVSIGDSKGGVHLIRLHADFELSTEVGMKKKNQLLFALSVKENYSQRAVHRDWVSQMRFISEVDSLVTASADGTVAFLDIARGAVTKVFTGHKDSNIGVRAFSWSAFSKYIVSGGDRTLLFWDPFTLEVVMTIDSFRSPIVAVEVHDAFNKVFAALANKTVTVWHNITYEELQVAADPATYQPADHLSAMTFAPDSGSLFTAGNKITSWKLERSSEGMTQADDEDLCVALHNPLFHQVVLVKSLGLVKVYQAETGEIVRQFRVVPLDTRTGQPKKLRVDKDTGLYIPVIKHACFDKHQTRLIVTGCDLSVQFWNVNDGVNLLHLQPQLYSTTLAHVYANLPRSITAVSYEVVRAGDKRVPKKLIFVGTEHGNVCAYQEASSFVDDVPVVFLRVSDASKDHTSAHKAAAAAAAESPGKGGNLKHLVKSLIRVTKVAPARPAAAHVSSVSSHSHEDDSLAHHTGVHGHGIHRSGTESDKLEKERLSSTDSAVLWMRHIESPPLMLVAYASGLVTFWDLERHVRVHDLPLGELGPVLAGMKLKGEKQLAQAQGGAEQDAAPGDAEQMVPPTAPVHVPAPAAAADANSNKLEETTFSEAVTPGGATVTIRNAQSGKRSSVAYGHKARTIVRKGTLISLPPALNTLDTESDDLPDQQPSAERVAQSESPAKARPADFPDPALYVPPPFAGHKKASALPVMPQLRRDSAALVVAMSQQGRHHSAAVPKLAVSLRPALNYSDVVVSAEDSREQAFLHSDPGRKQSGDVHGYLARHQDYSHALNGGLDSGSSVLSSSTVNSHLPPLSVAEESRQLPPAEHTTQPPADNETNERAAATSEPKVVVDCVVVLVEAQVIIGACNDKYMRFWDLATHSTLCSCCYYHRADADREKHGHAPQPPPGGHGHHHHGQQHHHNAHARGTHSAHGGRHHSTHASHHAPGHAADSAEETARKQRSRVVDEAPVDEVLRHLATSDSEDLLIGGYDNGMVRLWSVQSYSIVTLRSLQTKQHNQERGGLDHGGLNFAHGLAISPITLLCEWTAHSSPILSIEYVWFDYESARPADDEDAEEAEAVRAASAVVGENNGSRVGTAKSGASRQGEAPSGKGGKREKHSDMGQDILEGYVLSAGVDQKVYLWSVHGAGRCVGEFGSYGWDINSEATWYRRAELAASNYSGAGSKRRAQAKARRPSELVAARLQATSAANITRDSLGAVDLSDSSYILRSIGRHAQHTTSELSRYVDELTRRIVNKPPAYTEVARQFTSIMTAHPIKVVKSRAAVKAKTHSHSLT